MPSVLEINRLRRRHGYKVGLLVLVLLAFVLRVYRLDGQSLWVDESITLSRSQQPLFDLLRNMPAEHAPLYFMLMHFWLPIAGMATDFAVRYPSLIFGVLCVPLIGQLGSALFGRRVGISAALFLAVNPFHVWYAQDARMYPLVTAFSIACLASLTLALQTNRWRYWALYAVFGVIAIYSHYYAGLILVVSGLFALSWLFWVPAEGVGKGRRWLASVIAMGLMFLPWLPQALRVFEFHGWRPPIEIQALLKSYLTAYSLGTSVPDPQGWWLTWGFLALAATGLVVLAVWIRYNPARRPGAALIFLWLLATIASGILLALRDSDFQDRYFIVATPAYYLAIAVGLSTLARLRRMQVIAVVGLAFILGTSAFSLRNHYTNPAFAKPDYAQVTAYMASRADPENDAIILDGTRESGVRRYYPGDHPQIFNLEGSRYEDLDEAGQEALFTEIAQQYRQVWLLIKSGGPGTARAWFSAHAFPVEGRWITDIFMDRYATSEKTLAPPQAPLSTREAGPIHLVGYTLPSSTTERPAVVPGDVIQTILYWKTDADLDVDYKVSLRLVDGGGQVVAAMDRSAGEASTRSSSWPPGEKVTDRQGLPVPANTPPGEYQLVVKLYDLDTMTDVVDAVLGPMWVLGEAGS